jgi:hypothetical protein
MTPPRLAKKEQPWREEGGRSIGSTTSCYPRTTICPSKALDTCEAQSKRHDHVSSLLHKLLHSTLGTVFTDLGKLALVPPMALSLAEALLKAGMVL